MGRVSILKMNVLSRILLYLQMVIYIIAQILLLGPPHYATLQEVRGIGAALQQILDWHHVHTKVWVPF